MLMRLKRVHSFCFVVGKRKICISFVLTVRVVQNERKENSKSEAIVITV